MALDFDRTYTVKEVSEILGLSLSTIYERSPEAGGLPAFKFTSVIRIKESDLQRWIDAQAIHQ